MRNPGRLSRAIQFNNGNAVQTVYGSQTRVNVTAGAASSSETAVPGGASAVEIRATGDIWLRFGNTGLGDAAADANSILFPGGEKFIVVPLDANGAAYDFFKVMRVGSSDVPVQMEAVAVQ